MLWRRLKNQPEREESKRNCPWGGFLAPVGFGKLWPRGFLFPRNNTIWYWLLRGTKRQTDSMTGTRPFYEQGLNFSCRRCSACCRHEPGFVFLTRRDLDSLAGILRMDRRALIAVYCRWVPFTPRGSDELEGSFPRGQARETLSLKEKSNFDCIFWKNGCTVYEARPVQCRTFPFWKSIVHSLASWKECMKDCPGIGKGRVYSRGEIEHMLTQESLEPIITRTV
jgi:Fe-S-cluster containining protein